MTARVLYAVRTDHGQTWWLPAHGQHHAPNAAAARILARILRRPGITWHTRRDWSKAWRAL